MKKTSAGLVLYRQTSGKLEVLIAHMGSPWWARKDKGAWTIPKGEYEDEEPLAAARREFREELGSEPPEGELIELGSVEQSNNKIVTAWALEGDLDVSKVFSNKVTIEWPPRSGVNQEFPEIDKAAWVTPAVAAQKVVAAQAEFFGRLIEKLGVEPEPDQPVQGSLF